MDQQNLRIALRRVQQFVDEIEKNEVLGVEDGQPDVRCRAERPQILNPDPAVSTIISFAAPVLVHPGRSGVAGTRKASRKVAAAAISDHLRSGSAEPHQRVHRVQIEAPEV